MQFRGRRLVLILLLCAAPFSQFANAAAKVHVVSFGKSTSVPWLPGARSEKDKPLPLKVRALIVDGQIKEYILGSPHEVTERLFVVRRAFRVNDSLPEESTPHWQWQRGGWLLVDRVTGRVSAVALPEFDAFSSTVSWYRDYAAYCGISDDGKKIDAIVAQLARRKPVLKKALSEGGVPEDAAPDSVCVVPAWQRGPVRVSFEAAGAAKQTFAIRGHVVDMVNDDDAEEASK